MDNRPKPGCRHAAVNDESIRQSVRYHSNSVNTEFCEHRLSWRLLKSVQQNAIRSTALAMAESAFGSGRTDFSARLRFFFDLISNDCKLGQLTRAKRSSDRNISCITTRGH